VAVAGSRIFISYRRGDSSPQAGRLSDRLADEFGADRVFMDVDAIEPGADFVDYIEEAVGSCDVLVALIGGEWLESRDELGNRRLDDPEDFVRLEVAAGLERDIRVVPVLVEGATMPRAHDLPEQLRLLARRNALEISDSRWRHDVGRLVETIHNVLDGKSTHDAIRESELEARVEASEPSGAPDPPPPPPGPQAGPPSGPPPRPAPARSGWRRPALLASLAIAVLVIAGIAALAVVVGSGAEGGPGPPPEEQLRAHIPASVSPKCDPVDPRSEDLVSTSALAVFVCRPSSGVLLDYYLFRNASDTFAEYREQKNSLRTGSCIDAWEVEGQWDLNERFAGKWKCYDVRGTSVMEWTHDSLHIYTLMSSRRNDRRAMRRLWKIAGPE
jgi:hypothetical protein